MARKLRVEYPGAIYHVMNRGDRRERIFVDDADRRRFVDTLDEACAKTGWQVHAYVLMPNHFHVVIETPQPNLVAGMKWLLGTYTSRFNRRHQLFGHLFSGRYNADRGRFGRGLSQERGRLRPLESGAGEPGGGGCALEEFSLEQLAGVLARALETSGVVAGGSVAGRVWHPQGQSGGAATA